MPFTKQQLIRSLLGWTLMIYGLGAFLFNLEDGHIAGCGGIDPADCPPVLGNLWILIRPTGFSFFILCAGLMIVLLEKRFRIPALCVLGLGMIYFVQTLATFPKFCP